MQPSVPDVPVTQVIVVRPGEGLARGQYAWPDWGIALLGAVSVVAALVVLALRRARSRSSS